MSSNSDETIPQISSLPPPPPPQVASGSVPWISVQTSRPMNVAMQHLPPPPPPPYPAVSSTSTTQQHNTVYHGQSPQPSTSSALSQLPLAVPMFDATRPPPPMYTLVEPNNNTLKRKRTTNCAAGPSKMCKREEGNTDDTMCDACVQRDISLESYRIEKEKLNSEDEVQNLLFNKKILEYRRQKDFLRSLVGSSNIYRRVEEFVEGVPQYNPHSVSNDSFLTELSPSIPKRMLLQIVKYFLSDSQKYESSTMSRSPARRSSPDLLQTLQDMLYNEDRSSSLERPGYGELNVERPYSNGTNGLSSYRQYSNGQHVEQLAPPPPVPTTSSAPLAQPVPPPPPPAVTYPHYLPPRTNYPHPSYPSEPRPSTSRAPVLPNPNYPLPHTPHYPPEPRPSTSRAPVSPRSSHNVTYTTHYPSEPRPSTSRAPVSPRSTQSVPYTPFYPPEPRPSTSGAPVPQHQTQSLPYTPSSYYYQ